MLDDPVIGVGGFETHLSQTARLVDKFVWLAFLFSFSQFAADRSVSQSALLDDAAASDSEELAKRAVVRRA